MLHKNSFDKYSKQDFKVLKNNLKIFNFDITYSKEEEALILSPFTVTTPELKRESSSILSWLDKKFPNIGKIYKEAVDNSIAGESVSCISNCRNIITGIFSEYKDDGNRSWVAGLQKVSSDTNIHNVRTPNNIHQGSANIENGEFKYPRFQVIYRLYTLVSDLGAHSTEAPKIDGKLCPEITTSHDALWCLRMTEDVLL
ncbi:hypothetical protein [Niallia taxi]|uniref:hypothetical protein n=1 Tax=Niallia taxi TaxID=2499688 RepID=UPI002549F0DF|nr:hypothetical protein [Niallia taxi]MDK8643450.1 hypothetical protein [Niallia taxi]